jgi:hypothetical protein
MKLSNVIAGAALFAGLGACGGGQVPEAAPPAVPPAATAPVPAAAPDPLAQTAAVRCEPSPRMAVEGRASPYDSAMIHLGDDHALVCYGRPSARGRTILGGEQVPFGQLWRTGANEPTILHLPFAARVANIGLEPGSYSLYTIPGEREWTVILNRSTAQWGHESQYTEAVRAQEVGRAAVPVERTAEHIETFTIRSEPAGADRADMVLEWERTRVRVPVTRR